MNPQSELDFSRKRYPDVPGYARRSRTSYEAAVNALDTAAGKRARVLAVIRERGGATADEIVQATGLPIQTVTPRIVELRERDRMIVDGGERRPTRTGRNAVVWVLRD